MSADILRAEQASEASRTTVRYVACAVTRENRPVDKKRDTWGVRVAGFPVPPLRVPYTIEQKLSCQVLVCLQYCCSCFTDNCSLITIDYL